ncbi:hypothetical protein TWF696_004543 [Orbilia brochopaga]|uniref:Uncharacterized protein n=1 Tax=Orbilia brochopaga TaxID=3140254 RepID=A0AAV9V6L3_9PEZI
MNSTASENARPSLVTRYITPNGPVSFKRPSEEPPSVPESQSSLPEQPLPPTFLLHALHALESGNAPASHYRRVIPRVPHLVEADLRVLNLLAMILTTHEGFDDTEAVAITMRVTRDKVDFYYARGRQSTSADVEYVRQLLSLTRRMATGELDEWDGERELLKLICLACGHKIAAELRRLGDAPWTVGAATAASWMETYGAPSLWDLDQASMHREKITASIPERGVNGHIINGHGANGVSLDYMLANDTTPNDNIANGARTNGHLSNGNTMNGHGINGHTPNGHSTNGHTPNGYTNGHGGVNGHASADHRDGTEGSEIPNTNGVRTNGHLTNGHAPSPHLNGVNGHTPNGNGVHRGRTPPSDFSSENCESADSAAIRAGRQIIYFLKKIRNPRAAHSWEWYIRFILLARVMVRDRDILDPIISLTDQQIKYARKLAVYADAVQMISRKAKTPALRRSLRNATATDVADMLSWPRNLPPPPPAITVLEIINHVERRYLDEAIVTAEVLALYRPGFVDAPWTYNPTKMLQHMHAEAILGSFLATNPDCMNVSFLAVGTAKPSCWVCDIWLEEVLKAMAAAEDLSECYAEKVYSRGTTGRIPAADKWPIPMLAGTSADSLGIELPEALEEAVLRLIQVLRELVVI